jgi:hypothetical protein
MSIQIENSGSTIKITDNGVSFNIPKPFYIRYTQDILQPGDVIDYGRIIIQYYTGTESQEWNCIWTDITIPVAETIEDVYAIISSYEGSANNGQSLVNIQTVSDVSEIPAGFVSISFTTSSDFVGTIYGSNVPADTIMNITAEQGKTLGVAPYAVIGGSLYIVTLTY